MVTITEVPLFPESPPDRTILELDLKLIESNDVGPVVKDALVNQIKAFGVLEPIKVIPIPPEKQAARGGHQYEVIDGRRRLHAAWKVGHETIPAIVISIGADEAYASLIALASHALRSENHAWELSKLEAMLAAGSSQVEIARHSGMTVGQIKERLRLLTLIEPLRIAFDSSRLSFSQAKRISALPQSVQIELDRILEAEGKLTGEDVKTVTRARRADAATNAVMDLGDLDDDQALRPEQLSPEDRPQPPADPDPGMVAQYEAQHDADKAVLAEAVATIVRQGREAEQVLDTIAQALDLLRTRRKGQAEQVLSELLERYRTASGAPVAVPE